MNNARRTNPWALLARVSSTELACRIYIATLLPFLAPLTGRFILGQGYSAYDQHGGGLEMRVVLPQEISGA